MLAIVAHTLRGQAAHTLFDHTNAAYMAFDNGTWGCDGNHRRTWQWLNTHINDDWGIVLEDDAQPVDGFREQLDLALAAVPPGINIVSLYLGTGRPPTYQPLIANIINTDSHYIISNRLLHAVAVAIRRPHIQPMLDWTDRHPLPWDEAITDYAQRHGELIAYTNPSLVDHADEETLFTHPDHQPRTEPRKAWRLGARETWTTTTQEL